MSTSPRSAGAPEKSVDYKITTRSESTLGLVTAEVPVADQRPEEFVRFETLTRALVAAPPERPSDASD